jgi:hypothetical protein
MFIIIFAKRSSHRSRDLPVPYSESSQDPWIEITKVLKKNQKEKLFKKFLFPFFIPFSLKEDYANLFTACYTYLIKVDFNFVVYKMMHSKPQNPEPDPNPGAGSESRSRIQKLFGNASTDLLSCFKECHTKENINA